MTGKRTVRGVIALTMTAGVMVGAMLSCNGDGASGTDWGIPATLVLSEMTAPQREIFCGRVSEPGAVCEATGQGTGSGTTPVQACLDTFASLPNCTVAQYQRCVEEQRKDPCGAPLTSACQEVAACPGMDVPPPSGNTPNERWYAICILEAGTGVGWLVWEIRRRIDKYQYSYGGSLSAPAYCTDYSKVCDHYNWQEGCVCKYGKQDLDYGSCTGR